MTFFIRPRPWEQCCWHLIIPQADLVLGHVTNPRRINLTHHASIFMPHLAGNEWRGRSSHQCPASVSMPWLTGISLPDTWKFSTTFPATGNRVFGKETFFSIWTRSGDKDNATFLCQQPFWAEHTNVYSSGFWIHGSHLFQVYILPSQRTYFPWSYPRMCCHYNDEGKFVGKCQDQRLILMK